MCSAGSDEMGVWDLNTYQRTDEQYPVVDAESNSRVERRGPNWISVRQSASFVNQKSNR